MNDRVVYLDFQASSPLDDCVLDAMIPYFKGYFGNPHSDHAFAWRQAVAVENASMKIAELIGGDPTGVIFLSGATEANNLALKGIASSHGNSRRRRILVSEIEHKCVLNAASSLSDRYEISHLKVDGTGNLDLEHLRSEIDDDVLLVSTMYVNNEIGVVQNLKAISEIARSHGAIFHTDAAQAPGYVDTTELADLADLISLSAHKFYGPQGIGCLYVSPAAKRMLHPMMHGGGQQGGLRSGTVPVALCVGMGQAAIQALDWRMKVPAMKELRDLLCSSLLQIPGVKLIGPELDANRHPGNMSLSFEGVYAQELLSALQPSVAASTGSACNTGLLEPSHVLKSIGVSREEALSTLRISVGASTTTDDVEYARQKIKSMYDALR